MKRGWWAVAAVMVLVAAVVLARPWSWGDSAASEEPDAGGGSAYTTAPGDQGDVRRAALAEDGDVDAVRVVVDRDDEQQEWRGVGGTLTDAAVALLSETPRESWSELLAPVSMVRLPLTATDLSTEAWSWGWDGTSATPPAQAEAAVEVLQAMLEERPDLQVVLTPWSAPPSMKATDSLDGGALRGDAVDDYAAMLVSQVEELQARGVPVAALTLGNAPSSGGDYPSMTMSADQQATLALRLQPQLPAEVELWAGDDDWAERTTFDAVLTAAPFGTFAAAAFHCEEGTPSQMTPLPVPAIVTECSGATGSWEDSFERDLRELVVGSIGAGSEGLMRGSLALDPDGGPRASDSGGCSDCRGLVTVDGESVTPEPELAVLAMLDRAAPPGSRVLGSEATGGSVSQVAFESPDGTVGVLLRNDGSSVAAVSVAVGDDESEAYAVEPGELLVVQR